MDWSNAYSILNIIFIPMFITFKMYVLNNNYDRNSTQNIDFFFFYCF